MGQASPLQVIAPGGLADYLPEFLVFAELVNI
jgi:hypothetical protein